MDSGLNVNGGSFGPFGASNGGAELFRGTTTNDVIIATEKKGSNGKKWAIIIFSFLALLLLCGGVLVLLNNVSDGAKKALDEYGSFLSKEESDEYFIKLKGLYSNFLDKAENEEEYKSVLDDLKSVDRLIDQVAILHSFEMVNNDELLNRYIVDGYDATARYVIGFFDRKNMNSDVARYATNMRYYYSVFLKVVKLYDEGGCISNGKVDTVCATNASEADEALMMEIENSFEIKEECSQIVKVMKARLLNSYDAIKELISEE